MFSILSKDLVYTFRENVLIYVVVVPLVIALGMRLFVPSLENVELTFAVDSSVPADVVAQLEDYAKVELVDNREQLRERVLEFDDVPGIYVANDTFKVILEGNEASYVRELPGIIIDRLQHGESLADISVASMNRGSSMAREYGTIILMLLSLMVGGMALGYSIVNERESSSVSALAVTPLTTGDYLLAKSILATVISVVLSVGVATILMGPAAVDYDALVVTTLSSVGLGLIFGFLLGMLSANQLSAIALTKTLTIPFATVPAIIFLVPEKWHWILYPLPNYWSFVAMQRLFVHTDLPLQGPNLLTVATSLLFIALIVPAVARTIRV